LLVQFWSPPSLFPLPCSWTLRVFVEHFNIGSRKENKEKRKKRSSKEDKDQEDTTGLLGGIDLHV